MKIDTKIILTLVALCFTIVCDARCDSFECKQEIDKKEYENILSFVEDKYRKVNDLQARFIQNSYFLGLNQKKASSGKVFFKKPGMMDWQYETPQVQRFLADGNTLSFYQPDLNQITLSEFNNSFSSELPVLFLLGVGELKESFDLMSACRTFDGDYLLKLSARSKDANLNEFLLLAAKKDYLPLGARITDVGGNETSIVFYETDVINSIDVEQFKFSPPKGVDIIDNRKKLTAQ